MSSRFCALFLFMAVFTLSMPSWALDVKAVRFGLHADKERGVIELSAPTKFRAFVMQNPDRIIVDMADFQWKVGNVPRGVGTAVKDVRYGDLGGGQGRLVIETNKPVMIKSAFAIERSAGQPDRLVIDFSPTSSSMMKESGGQVLGTLKGGQDKNRDTADTPKPKKDESSRRTNSRKLIILDPGHGGQDPGAIGANGMYEKTIVLAVALELRRQLEDAGYRVEMTRSTDVFIPLRDRVRFARKKGGDLFMSLHADSVGVSSVAGASVYTLSDKASDKETEKLAERENKSDLIAGIDLSHQEDDVADILIDLAARDTMNQSRYLAKTVIHNLHDDDVKVLDKKFRSAGFAVLKAMDIPSVLVEMGYLTNRAEVERLSTKSYQQRVASSLKDSIDRFFQKK